MRAQMELAFRRAAGSMIMCAWCGACARVIVCQRRAAQRVVGRGPVAVRRVWVRRRQARPQAAGRSVLGVPGEPAGAALPYLVLCFLSAFKEKIFVPPSLPLLNDHRDVELTCGTAQHAVSVRTTVRGENLLPVTIAVIPACWPLYPRPSCVRQVQKIMRGMVEACSLRGLFSAATYGGLQQPLFQTMCYD